MGYSGRILVAKTEGPYRGGAAPVLWESERKDGWRWIQFDGDAAGALAEAVATTGMPALWAYIMDSDVADVEALTPGGQLWRTYLHPDVAEEFGAPPLVLSVDEVVAAALDWAAQAGLTADPGDVRAALEAVNVEAEETLAALATALGT